VLPVAYTVFIIAAVFVDAGHLQGIGCVWRYRGQRSIVRRVTENIQRSRVKFMN